MPRKWSLVLNDSNTKLPPPITPAKRQSSTKRTLGAKRKALPKLTLKRPASSAGLEAPEDGEASPDEGELQNPELDDATQARQPAINSDILPLPWKGRLGFAYILYFSRLIVDV